MKWHTIITNILDVVYRKLLLPGEEKHILLLYFEGKKKKTGQIENRTFHTDRREWRSVAHYTTKILFTPNYVFHILIAQRLFLFLEKKKDSGASVFFPSYMQLI